MTTATKEPSTCWVCVDCYETHHGVREGWREAPDREPLNLIAEDAEVTAGLLIEEHAEDCEARRAAEQGWANEVECDCERITFSKSWCHGCGSTLAGAREALTVWTKEEA